MFLGALLSMALAPQTPQTAVITVDLLDNGDFRAPRSDAADERAQLVPWWRSEGGALELVEEGERVWLRTSGGASALQPIAAFEPLASGLVLRGRVRGEGVLTLTDGANGEARFELEGARPDGAPFELGAEDWQQRFGRPLVPRFELRVAGRGGAAAEWSELHALVPLPAPDEAQLRAEILEHLDWIFRLWIEKGLDREGPRATGFFCHAFDAVTGERLATAPGGVSPVAEALLDAAPLARDGRWDEPLERFLADYLELGFHPETGLPRKWDALSDAPLDDRWVEIAADLRFLLDAHERGPERFRGACLERARKIGETVLARGVLPDGQVAAKYRALDAEVSLAVPPLRRLDVPAQLARLGAVLDDERYTTAARNALAELEYTLHWPGTWDAIDPGFDDDLGHYGKRAQTMLEAHPEDPAFRNLVASGFAFYAPLWRDALRYGGAIAADEVRSWELFLDFARFEPAAVPVVRELVPMAARAHFQGEQYRDGAWGDVTFYRYDPKSNLSVGDLPGTPSNLLVGLAFAYDRELGLATPELRAMYAAVLRSTDAHYRREFGYLVTQRELESTNRGGGELRLLAGLIEMLDRLP